MLLSHQPLLVWLEPTDFKTRLPTKSIQYLDCIIKAVAFGDRTPLTGKLTTGKRSGSAISPKRLGLSASCLTIARTRTAFDLYGWAVHCATSLPRPSALGRSA
jgi:hypothetical protein